MNLNFSKQGEVSIDLVPCIGKIIAAFLPREVVPEGRNVTIWAICSIIRSMDLVVG
jgi:hypothetical protein